MADEVALWPGIIEKLLPPWSPAHAWAAHPKLNPDYESKRSTAFDLGIAAHALLLGGQERIVIVDAEDFKTKAAREARDAAYADRKVPILAGRWIELHAMVAELREQLENSDAEDAFQPGGVFEEPIRWREDVSFSIRPDWTYPDRSRIYDYKVTSGSAHPDAVTRQIFNLGHDVQAALYCRGAMKVHGARDPEFRFVFQEESPPYKASIIGLTPYALALAEQKIDRAAKLWRICLDRNEWPGHPRQVCYVDPPAYIAARAMEQADV